MKNTQSISVYLSHLKVTASHLKIGNSMICICHLIMIASKWSLQVILRKSTWKKNFFLFTRYHIHYISSIVVSSWWTSIWHHKYAPKFFVSRFVVLVFQSTLLRNNIKYIHFTHRIWWVLTNICTYVVATLVMM